MPDCNAPTARLARGLAALLILAGSILGVPLTMVAIDATPIPHHLPTWEVIRQRLLEPDDGTLLVNTLALLVWAAWALFTAITLAEILGRVTGRTAPRITSLRGTQDRVSALVAAVTMLASVAAPTAIAAASPPAQHTTAPPTTGERPPNNEKPQGPTTPQTGHQSPRGRPAFVYTVARHDTLWRIAERHLGAGLRYREIVALNLGRRQADGQTFSNADVIRPGWTLLLPIDAKGLPDPAPPATADERMVVVQPGDTLWDLAERELGDGTRYPQIADANVGRLQPDGRRLTNPDDLRPGWRLVIPARDHPSPPTSADTPTNPTRPTQPPPPHSTSRPQVDPTQPSEPSKSTQDTAEPPTSHPPPRENTRAQGDHAQTPSGTVRLVSGGLVSVALAGAVGVALTRVRLRRLRQYRPGTPGRPHASFLVPPAVRRLCRALTSSQAYTETACDTAVEAHASEIVVATHQDVDGQRDLIVDVASTGGLGLVGPGATSATRALLITHLARHRPRDLEVVIAAPDFARLLGAGAADQPIALPNLTLTEDLDEALAKLEAEQITRTRLLDDTTARSIDELRRTSTDEPLPMLLLVATPEAGALQRLSAILRLSAEHDIGAVLLGDWPDGTTYRIQLDGKGTTTTDNQASGEIQFFHLPLADTTDLFRLLHDANTTDSDTPADTTETTKTAAAQEPPPEPRRTQGPAPVGLTLFGPPKLCAGDREIPTGLRTNARELLLYLALRPHGATLDETLDALWPDSDPIAAKSAFHAAVGNIRKVLRDTTGLRHEKFLLHTTGRYRLDPDTIAVDLWQFRHALHDARHQKDSERLPALQRTSSLYIGTLAEGMSFDWLENEREHVRRDALDVLTSLGQLQQQHDPEAALATLERALTHDPYCDELYQRVMRLQAALGRPEAVKRTYHLLKAHLAEIDAEPDDTTEHLLHRLLQKPTIGDPTNV